MTDRGDDARPVVVDVGGLPRRLGSPLPRWWPHFWVVLLLLVVSLGGVMLVAVDEDPHPWALVALGCTLVSAALNLLVHRGTHLLLAQDGVRERGVLRPGRLRPWAEVEEVRPPDAWHPAPHLRVGRGRLAGAVDLRGLTTEDAVELQRRLVAARAVATHEEEAGS